MVRKGSGSGVIWSSTGWTRLNAEGGGGYSDRIYAEVGQGSVFTVEYKLKLGGGYEVPAASAWYRCKLIDKPNGKWAFYYNPIINPNQWQNITKTYWQNMNGEDVEFSGEINHREDLIQRTQAPTPSSTRPTLENTIIK